ncbi:site-specific DNA-methyltransferase [Helicobacter canis]|uniref:Type III restriction-modification system methylation subunit n=1 Tax=Helicobacter canis TaxID=29419 RepID=A0A377J303_9HELI|nr:site-specific DNA-methyltransferase [Helicobacter canis]STO96882.1 type III restriction-modification system methylation subunit [Helicobacter canis]
MDYKKAFYSRLEECYLGAKIKVYEKANTAQNTQSNTSNAQDKANKKPTTAQNAQSGFSNLLSIKEQYFSHIKAYLDSAIPNDDFNSHDIYNKLYTFFDSYLNDTGTPFFHDTPLYKNIYAKVYTNSKDTSLFYKTKDLYYVKSDTLYTSLTLSDENELTQIYFDTSEYRQNADNTKRKLIFKLDKIEQTSTDTQDSIPTIYIKVLSQKDLFPDLNAVFKENSNELSEDFIKSLKAHKFPLDEAHIKKLFASYKKQNEVDFFIHKNARVFLQEQFDLWFYHYLYKDSEFQEWSVKSISHLQKIRNIALEIIGLIGDFEDELKAVWLKPKFAKVVNYVFSLDLILRHSALSDKAQNTALLDSICKDKGFEKQIKEWQDLKLIDESFQAQNISEKILNDEKYKFLPLDTRHFSKEIKYKILSVFDDIESILNGELIRADNFQALNSLMPKYQNKVDLIYIDPPYNTGNDGFIYTDKFNHSSWLSMITNRLELAKEFLKDNGSIFISIDDNEQARLKILCDEIFGEENFVANIIWEKVFSAVNLRKGFSPNHDFISVYSKNIDKVLLNPLPRTEEANARYKNPDNDPRGVWTSGDLSVGPAVEANIYEITLPSGRKILPPKGYSWRLSKEKFEEYLKDNRIYFNGGDSVPRIKRFLSEVKDGITPLTIWKHKEVGHNQDAAKEILALFDDKLFDTPKPEKLLKRIFEIATKADFKAEVFEMRNCGFQDKGEGSLVSLNDRDFGAESAIYRSKTAPIVLDFFAGSGTSVATAQKLGRKWLGIEMGEHFYKVIIPRLKKVIAGFQSGISKECDYKGSGAFRYYELESYEEALKECEYVLMDSEYTKPFSCHTKAPSTCHTEALAEVSKNIESKRDISLPLNMTSLHSDTTNSQRDISASPQYDKEAQYTATYKDSQSIYSAKDYQKAQKIIDYRKSRKLIKKLNKGETITLDMSGYRKEFDLFHTLANLQGLKIKRLFLDSKGIETCKFDNGDIVSLDQIDLHSYPKLKNLLWWEKL